MFCSPKKQCDKVPVLAAGSPLRSKGSGGLTSLLPQTEAWRDQHGANASLPTAPLHSRPWCSSTPLRPAPPPPCPSHSAKTFFHVLLMPVTPEGPLGPPRHYRSPASEVLQGSKGSPSLALHTGGQDPGHRVSPCPVDMPTGPRVPCRRGTSLFKRPAEQMSRMWPQRAPKEAATPGAHIRTHVCWGRDGPQEMAFGVRVEPTEVMARERT